MSDFHDLELLPEERPADGEHHAAVRSADVNGREDDDPLPAEQTSTGAEADDTSEHSVFGMIATVEEQLKRIRSAQMKSDEQFRSLEDRAKSLDDLERSLRERQAEIESRHQEIEAEHARIASDREEVNRRLEECEQRAGQLASDEETLDELRRLIEADQQANTARAAEFETERARIDEATALLDSKWASLKQEQQESERRAAEVEACAADAERKFAQLQKEAAEHQRVAAQALSERDQMKAEHDDLVQRIEQAERNVGELIGRIEASQKCLEEESKRRETTESQLQELQQQRDDTTTRADELKAEVESMRARLASLESEAKALRSERAALEASVASYHEEADSARRACATIDGELQRTRHERARFEDQVRHLQNENTDLERSATELRTERDALQQRVDEITGDFEQKAAAFDQEKSNLERLSAELRADRDGLQVRLEEVQAALDEKSEAIEQHERMLSAAKEKLTEFASAIGEQTEQIQRGMAAIAEVREQKRQIERLKEQLAQSNMAGNPEELARRDARIAELTEALRQARGQSLSSDDIEQRDQRIESLEEQVDRLRADLERARIEHAETQDALETARAERGRGGEEGHEVVALKAKISELEASLIDAESRISQGASADQADLKRKAQSIRQAVEHLRRRRARLERVKRLLDERRKSAESNTAHPVDAAPSPGDVSLVSASAPRKLAHDERERIMQAEARLRQEREHLREATRALAASEQAMVRQWARPRAVTTVVWLGILAAILAVGSWLAADHLFPQPASASVTIKPKERAGFPLTDEQRADWHAWHESKLYDDAFHRTAAKRFGDRRFDHLRDPESVNRLVSDDLSIDSVVPGEITLTLTAATPAAAQQTLDLLAATLAAMSRAEMGMRADNAEVEFAGRRTEGGQTRISTINPAAHDGGMRLKYAGMIFVGSLFSALMLIGFVYSRLVRAKRIFEEDGEDINLMQAATD